MSGVSLSELELSDTLDVIHYMFEEDMKVTSPEQAEAMSKARSMLYRQFYNREYKYVISASKTVSSAAPDIDAPLGEPPVPVDPSRGARTAPPKPFIPATTLNPDTVNPFGTTLDSPLN